MKIAIVGTGYVGLVSGTCFAEMGTEVYCVDVDTKKIEELNKGIMPIYEPGLKEMVLRNQQAGRLHFLTDLSACLNDVEVVFSAVGTPPDEDGSADLKYVLSPAGFGRIAFSWPASLKRPGAETWRPYGLRSTGKARARRRPGPECTADLSRCPCR